MDGGYSHFIVTRVTTIINTDIILKVIREDDVITSQCNEKPLRMRSWRVLTPAP